MVLHQQKDGSSFIEYKNKLDHLEEQLATGWFNFLSFFLSFFLKMVLLQDY